MRLKKAASSFGGSDGKLPADHTKRSILGRRRERPLLSRIICAAEAFSGSYVDELAGRCGITEKRLSQLRSGAHVDRTDVHRVLAELGLDLDTLIWRIEGAGDDHGSQQTELLALLVHLEANEPDQEADARAGNICCDRLVLILPESVRHRCSAALENARSNGAIYFDANYESAFRHVGVHVGEGLRWKDGRGLRLDFNPSKLRKRGRRFVRELLGASPTAEIRISQVDLAVDLATPIGWFQVQGTQARKHSIIGTSRRLETIYIGDRTSKLCVSIYDKRAEQQDEEGSPLTRVEARLKKISIGLREFVSLADPFRSLRVLWLSGTGLGFIDRLLTACGRIYGWAFLKRELEASHFARLQLAYQKSANAVGCVHPSSIFRSSWESEARRTLTSLGIETSSL